MIATHLRLENWRNFRSLDVPLHDTTYVLGANAVGKSNLLDVFRFLRDVAKPQGGGLQKALELRGGTQKLRCLHARSNPEVCIDVLMTEPGPDSATWRYVLAFKSEPHGKHETRIAREEVWKDDICLLSRPDAGDKRDRIRLTQTALEQIQVNAPFREIATFFGAVTYLHLVPQLLKFGDRIGGIRLEDDPFGQGFLDRIANTPQTTRTARLKRIQEVLVHAVPQFAELKFERDEHGQPHLSALYEHYRPKAGWQREVHFSDGTLRLVALLLTLLEGDSMLLLEEPELSLNDAIVEQIPSMMARVSRRSGRKRQIIISTHSEALLSNPGIDGRGVILLQAGREGSEARSLEENEKASLKAGFSVAEIVLPKARPVNPNQMMLPL